MPGLGNPARLHRVRWLQFPHPPPIPLMRHSQPMLNTIPLLAQKRRQGSIRKTRAGHRVQL